MNRRRQKGIALVLVLWILILVTVATSAYALMARMDQLEANQLLSGTQARFWAEAGLNLAAVALRDTNDETRMIADGRIYQQEYDGVSIAISAVDERGKLDINAADEATFVTLFTNNGMEPDQAEVLAAAVMDWRDSDDVERVNGAEADAYQAAGLPTGPGNRPFMMVDELLQVMGMTYDFYKRIEPGLTVWSRSALPQIGYAPVEALLALPDLTTDEASEFVTTRQSSDLASMPDIALPNGESVVAQGRGVTYSIQVRATMPNGVWEQIETTIRLGGSPAGQPFRVLRWHEGYSY